MIDLNPYDLVVIAASAGGLNALTFLLSHIPPGLPASFVIVQHLAPHRTSFMANILSSKTQMSVKQAGAIERIRPGWVYIAPPDHHLIIYRHGYMMLTQTPPVHFVRPAADMLFASAAKFYMDRVAGIILTGNGQDGSAGVAEIKRKGGYTIAQDPSSADYSGMPLAAVNTGMVDHVTPLAQIHVHLMEKMQGGCYE